MKDYIIIGGGTAGCILASRLSEDVTARVTLVEAGGSGDGLLYRMPAGYLQLMKSGNGNWGFHSVPQAGLGGRAMYFPRGRVLGGSGALNGLVYVRGNPGDFDHWARLGNRGWSYSDCLPFFRAIECFEGGEDDYRGGDGPIGVSIAAKPDDMSPIGQALMAAAAEAGFPATPDYNGAQQEGFARANANVSRGRRQSSASTYLAAARGRRNLRIVTNAMTTRILLRGGRAYGVEYRHKGRTVQLETSGEVILAGGAINSPQLLQLSGIGPAALLRDHGVPMVHDLPGVGENLQDHVGVMVKQEITQPYSALAYTQPLKALMALSQYLLSGTGPATSNGMEVLAFLKSRPGIDYPDVQYHFPMLLYTDHGREIIQREGFSAYANGLRPNSRGRVTIASADPAAAPRIDPNYFSDPDDLRVTRDAIHMARALIAQPALDGFRGPELEPGKDVRDDTALNAFIKRTAVSVYHPVGTCSMGQGPLAVVDDRLRVHGVEGLRVVDASIMPTITSGNTNAPTMMIAERAAAFIAGIDPVHHD
ncbi:choline dehydrogenase [Sphingobium sp. 3R8]|uniref:GMC family oxidoreductase n=1 Tax=Sphingobium sp. 3R8 TaxID=2874921 RepID=UPI001CC9B1EF|nr:choline dehydrogenase [Sphingobium sp. 3R8]MBZ9646901.1 choline dehydrogenase [Sphingobium sp. 3R8]